MASVRLFSDQHRYCGGLREVEIEAGDYQELRAALLARFPDLPAELLDDVIVAIDGEIVHRPLLEEIQPDSKVLFVGRTSAG